MGKSTLFKALTTKQVDIQNYPFTTIDPNVGVVAVPDERLKPLAELSNSKKIIILLEGIGFILYDTKGKSEIIK